MINWDDFYKEMAKKKIGIYMITSPSGRVYIGQSWNIKSRFSQYRTKSLSSVKNQRLLCKSFRKYGIASHQFDIIHVFPYWVEQETVDKWEVYYIGFFRRFGLLNIKEGGSKGNHSEETKQRIREANTGFKHTNDTKHKFRINNLGELSHTAKLTNDLVLQIRSEYKSGIRGYGYKSLSKKYEVHNVTISNIIRRITWNHI